MGGGTGACGCGSLKIIMAGTETLLKPEETTSADVPWNVVVFDDPVNLMGYVAYVFMKVFGYGEGKATKLMLEVHKLGKSIVWTGGREQAEFHMQQLQAHHLRTNLEKSA